MQEYTFKKRPVITIALITAICLLGNEMLFIVLPIYWKFFGLDSLWQVGVLLSINRFVRIPINSIVGWCYHKISKRTGVLFAIVLASFSTYSYGVLKGFWLLLLVRILWGVAWSFLRLGGYLTVIASSDGKTRGQLIGLYNGLWGLGTLFGMLIGGLLSDLVGISSITTGFAILAVLTIPLAIKFIPNVPNAEHSVEKQTGSTLGSALHRKVLFNGLFVAFVVYGVFFTTISKVIEFHLDGTVLIWGMSIGAAAITGVVQSVKMGIDPFLAPAIGRWSDLKFGRVPLLTIAFLGGALFLAVIPFAVNYALLLAMILAFQIICTLLITMSDSLAADLAKGPLSIKTMTNYTLFADLGAAVGPLLSFIVLDFVGLPWLYGFTSLLLFIAFLFWLKEIRKQKVQSTSMQEIGL
ncbi:MFS transporter [Bacillus sp. FJAT-49732]|uniref:MFS transporter n=1 Tax=Lederbergia citrisecunda TaxID=2833583 RepID=A0A942YL10_9BACI|nr:MFS transporter [Lederbergia citrisecunda]MBS4200973.1 MFS transporter [Lederbergia citrisecunda]